MKLVELNINNHIVDVIQKDIFQMEHTTRAPNERVWCITQLAKLSFNHPSVVLIAVVFNMFMSTRIQSAVITAVADAVCAARLPLLLQRHLAIACRRWKKYVVSLNLIQLIPFLHSKTRFLCILWPNCCLSYLWPRFSYILGNYGHARSHGEYPLYMILQDASLF